MALERNNENKEFDSNILSDVEETTKELPQTNDMLASETEHESIDSVEKEVEVAEFDDFEMDAIFSSLEEEKMQEDMESDILEHEDSVEQKEDKKKPVKKAKKKKKRKNTKGKGCLVTLLWLIIIGVLSVTIAFLGVFAASDYLGVGKDFLRGQETVDVQIVVEEGQTIAEIAQVLEDRGVLISRQVFLLYLKLTDRGTNISFGAHDFSTNMGYNEILASLAEPAKAEDVTVTIPSGKTVDEILHLLEDEGVCSYSQLRQEAMEGTFISELIDAIPDNEGMYYKIEGYLFPDTYQFYLNDDPHRVLQKMIDNLEDKFTPEMREKAKEMGYTTHEILTMASVVEQEACGYFDEMPKVAALFYNRLNQWPEGQRYLQSDPTMYYEYGDGLYDTYKIEGLPPGPMGSITEEALKAAVYPDKEMKAFFFVTDKNGDFYYNDTNDAHNDTIEDLKDKGLWVSTPFYD